MCLGDIKHHHFTCEQLVFFCLFCSCDLVCLAHLQDQSQSCLLFSELCLLCKWSREHHAPVCPTRKCVTLQTQRNCDSVLCSLSSVSQQQAVEGKKKQAGETGCRGGSLTLFRQWMMCVLGTWTHGCHAPVHWAQTTFQWHWHALALSR